MESIPYQTCNVRRFHPYGIESPEFDELRGQVSYFLGAKIKGLRAFNLLAAYREYRAHRDDTMTIDLFRALAHTSGWIIEKDPKIKTASSSTQYVIRRRRKPEIGGVGPAYPDDIPRTMLQQQAAMRLGKSRRRTT